MAAAAAASSGAGGAGSGGAGSGLVGGPQLLGGAGEQAWVASLNDWGRRVDASLGLMSTAFSGLRDEVVGTQTALVSTIQDAKVALNTMHEGFRMALDASGATQRADIVALIAHARTKFQELELKLETLSDTAQQTMALTEQWALGEGARTASQIAGAAGMAGMMGAPLAPPTLGGTPASTPPSSPRMPAPADPWGRQDPWRGGAAASVSAERAVPSAPRDGGEEA